MKQANDIEQSSSKLKAKLLHNQKKIRYLTICLVALIISLLIVWLSPRIILKGSDKVELNYQEKYKEKGAYAKYLFTKDKKVKINGKVNSNKLGTYKIIYNYKLGILNLKKERVVEVVDKEKPKITLTGGKEVSVCPGQEYKELGYEVSDNYDKDLKDKVKIKEDKKQMKITYTVEDKAHNKTVAVRKYQFKDDVIPDIKLKGSSEENIYLGQTYVDDGYEAIDVCDGDITNKVQIKGSVDTSKLGEYELIYSVTDVAGNTAEVSRKVRVQQRPTTSGNGIIYLTFDDGPSNSITPQLLDILKEENVKATFFVINHADNLNYLIKRAYDEGHTIGLHSYTHDYSRVYQSGDAYFNDLQQISNKVKNIIGVESKIIRFPGGGSNTISRKYSPGIMSYLTKEVVNRGYHYFDWNVGSGDAGEVNSASEVYQSVIQGLSHTKNNVVLMHDFENNYKTLTALRDIIKYARNNGYQFAKIDMLTPMVRHRVNN